MSTIPRLNHSEIDILPAELEDAAAILTLQKLAYQSEADFYQDYNIPPLTQTLDEIKADFDRQAFLKAVLEGQIVGSVRAYTQGDTCYIGRLIVHPDWQGKGIGTRLMGRIEACFPTARRFELFTGVQSHANLRLYQRLGYRPFKEQAISEMVTLIYLEKHIQGPE